MFRRFATLWAEEGSAVLLPELFDCHCGGDGGFVARVKT